MRTSFLLSMASILLSVLPLRGQSQPSLPTVAMRAAPYHRFPAPTDSNSPAHWDGRTLYLFNSSFWPARSTGGDLFTLGDARPVSIRTGLPGGIWLEATFRDQNGTLYGWYHNEPPGVCRPGLTAPRIGALRSTNNGLNWQDLGLVLETPPGTNDCGTRNFFFAGGNGDFSVLLDAEGQYLYFFFSNYPAKISEQGVAVARLKYQDRNDPAGKVWKWFNGSWTEPGLGGHVTPVFRVTGDWHGPNPDAFWGPSIHWNHHLGRYVLLLNRAIDPDWTQEGVYVSFHHDLSDPSGWSRPGKIFDGGGWYPQVIGTDAALKETDKLAGASARFFLRGESSYLIHFLNPGEPEPPPGPILIDFEGRPDGPLSGEYGGLDWGQGVWATGGPWAGVPSTNVFLNTGNASPASGRISGGSGGAFLLQSLVASADGSWTLSLTDSNGQSFQGSFGANEAATVVPGWTLPSQWLEVHSSIGWNAVFDSITYFR